MGYLRVVDPEEEPVTLTEAKAHLRVETSDDDFYISGLIKVARAQIEAWTGIQCITATWALSVDRFPRAGEALKLRRAAPIQSIESVKYIDENGVEQTLAGTVYQLDATVKPAELLLAYDQEWPTIRAQRNAVTIRYIAGDGDAPGDVPWERKWAILAYLGHLYENREPIVTGTIATPIPEHLAAVIDSLRVEVAA